MAILAIYDNLPTLFIKSLNDIINWPFSYHSVDDIHYHYHPLVFLNIIIRCDTSTSTGENILNIVDKMSSSDSLSLSFPGS